MHRRSRPSEQSTSAQTWDFEVYLIDKEPRPEKYRIENGKGISVKELVEDLCEKLGILPINTALFGLSYDIFGGKLYLPYSKVLVKEDVLKKKLYFRLQFKVDCSKLQDNAFRYYLQQCRHDFVHGKFKENLFKMQVDRERQEMLLRMLILEKLLIAEDEKKDGRSHFHIMKRRPATGRPFSIENILTKYIDDRSKSVSEEIKHNKRIIEKSLRMFESVSKPGIDFVREVGFLPEYSKETFPALKKVYGRNESIIVDDVMLSIDPAEGISRLRVMESNFKKVEAIIAFANVADLKITPNDKNSDAPKYQLIITRQDKKPVEVIWSNSKEELLCICSWIDGYYRLLVNQYNSLLEGRRNGTIHGPLERSVCMQLMENIKCIDGDFLIRKDRKKHKDLILTLKTAKDYEHIKMQYVLEEKAYLVDQKYFSTPDEVVRHLQASKKKDFVLNRMIKPSSTGPVPFLSERIAGAIVKKAAPLTSTNVLLLSAKAIIKQEVLPSPEGNFGTVWKCLQRKDPESQAAAIRFLSADDISQEAFEKLLNSCKMMMSSMFVRIIGASWSTDLKCISFEFMDGGPLDAYLTVNRKKITYGKLLKFIMDVAEGMMYLETKTNLVHGNLNSHNILLLSNGNIKISDACFDPVLQDDGKLKGEALERSFNWRAPEVLRGEKITLLSDSWSFGMTVWELMSLTKPFKKASFNELLTLIDKGTRPPCDILPYCAPEIEEILMSCWMLSPMERNTFTSITNQLQVYKRGSGSFSEKRLDTQDGKPAFPIETYLLNRFYYNWREEEASSHKQRLQETRELRERGRQLWVSPNSSDLHSGSSGSDYVLKTLSNSDASDFTGATPSGSSFGSHDIEMTDLNRKEEVFSTPSPPPLRPMVSTNSISLEERTYPESTSAECMRHSFKAERSERASLQGSSNEKDHTILDASEVGTAAVLLPQEVHSVGEQESMESEAISSSVVKENEVVTEDVMEIANVLASMAHHRKVDQKRPRVGENSSTFPQKYPRLISSPGNASSSIKERNKIRKMHSMQETMPHDVSRSREDIESGYDSSSYKSVGGEIDGIKGTHKRQKIAAHKAHSPSTSVPSIKRTSSFDDSEYVERKKGSHSLSEEVSKMQKKAARRALDIPNPFNLGTNAPKNFLLSLRDPVLLQPRTQPEDISKFFNAIPTNATSSLGAQEEQIKTSCQSEGSGHKPLSDIQQLEENFSSMKTQSPLNSSSPLDTSHSIQISQPLTYVVPPNQQALGSQHTEQSNIQRTINAYLANLGQSLVPGSPVLVPQITVSATTGQPIATTQLLQLLQAQQKINQLAQSSSEGKATQQKLSEGTLPTQTPDYLQTLLAIFASKNMHVSGATSSQQQQYMQVSTPVQPSRLTSATATTQAVTTTNSSVMGKSHDLHRKVVDIKPKPMTSSVDLAKSDKDVFVIPQSSIGQKIVQTSGGTINVINAGEDSRSQIGKPISVRTMQNQRPIFVDSKLSRPLLLKRDPSPQTVRAQHLILPKNLPEQLGRIEQSKEIKLAPKLPISKNLKTDSTKRTATGTEFHTTEIKVEPTSPTSQGYTFMESSARPLSHSGYTEQRALPAENFRFPDNFSPVKNIRKSEESHGAQLKMISQLGDLKIFRKKDLTFDRKLGEGQFGEVWKALLRCQGDKGVGKFPVAVKKLKHNDQMPLDILEEFRNEVKQMASLHNDYIVKLIGVSVDLSDGGGDPWIITELMPHGSLNQFIVRQRPTIVEDILLNFAVQIAKGMEFLQSCRIVHRDLAARNVLVESKDRVKVCDFGLSRMFGEKGYYRSHGDHGKTLIPVRWFAPESIQEQKFTSQSDVWSCGVTIWEMFELWGSEKNFATPYSNLNPTELLDSLDNGVRLEKPKRCSEELWSIVSDCWKHDPEDRLSFYRLGYEIERLLS